MTSSGAIAGKSWFPGAVHEGGANVLFCDGHVEWYLQKDLIDVHRDNPKSREMTRMWNNDHRYEGARYP